MQQLSVAEQVRIGKYYESIPWKSPIYFNADGNHYPGRFWIKSLRLYRQYGRPSVMRLSYRYGIEGKFCSITWPSEDKDLFF